MVGFGGGGGVVVVGGGGGVGGGFSFTCSKTFIAFC